MKKNDLTENEQRVAQLLLRYMKSHPETTHTAEGITRWWVLEQKLNEEVKLVEKVIDYYIENGTLEKVFLPGGKIY